MSFFVIREFFNGLPKFFILLLLSLPQCSPLPAYCLLIAENRSKPALLDYSLPWREDGIGEVYDVSSQCQILDHFRFQILGLEMFKQDGEMYQWPSGRGPCFGSPHAYP